MKIPNSVIQRESFYEWALSDINSNIKRGLLAEYLVNIALDTLQSAHAQWDDFDLTYRGKKIEVKSSGFLNPPFPNPRGVQNPSFDIKKRTHWWSDEADQRFAYDAPCRVAHIYIFCVQTAEVENSYRPFDPSQWEFTPILTKVLNESFQDQKTVAYTRLKQLAAPLPFGDLRSAVDALVEENFE